MIIINNQPIPQSIAEKMVGQVKHSSSIVSAMDNNRDIFNYPNSDLLKFNVQLRSHIVDSAYELSKSEVNFATFYRSRCNKDFWDITREGGFLLKSNVRASLAVTDIFQNGKLYAFECATAMIIVFLKGVLGVLHPDRFDALFHSIYLWDWHEPDHLPLSIEPISDRGVPGDIRYIKNPQVNPRTPWWQGENAIVLPEGLYYGHGIGIKPIDEVIQSLNKFRRPGATESAYLMHRATRLDSTALYLLSGRERSGWVKRRETGHPSRRRQVLPSPHWR